MDMSDEEILALARETVEREARAVGSIVNQLDNSVAEVARRLLGCPGHVFVTGTGTSHAVAQRLAHLLACCGIPALCINAADSLHGGSGAITSDDVIYIISKGGQSAEINRFAAIARARGATVIAQTEKPESPLGALSDLVFKVVAPSEVDPYGMIATGSSLVNSMAGDVLCVILLKLGGYTREQFGATHPGGAVGKRLAEDQKRGS